MDTAPARTAVDVEDRARLTPGVRPSRRRRRPTGAPPPLPRTFQVSSAGWLVATLALVALFAVTFAASRHGAALAVIAADDRVVEWFAGLRSPWLTRVTREAALLGSWGSIRTLTWCIFVSLLVFKRFRHLIVYFVLINLTFQLVVLLSAALKRPRPFGVAIEGSWNGYALPSIQVALLAASLVTLLYALVPEGRWRHAGKWTAVGIVAVAGVARVYLGADAPTDVLLGAALGVTIPLLAFRFITPNAVFPIRYRRGRTAHLNVGGARGIAIRQALTDQLGLVVTEVKPFGLAGSAGSTPVRITVKGDPDTHLFGKLYAKNHLRSDRSYKVWPRAAVRPAGGREVVQLRAPAGAAGGLRAAAAARRGAAQPEVVRRRGADARTGISAGHRVLRRCRRTRRGRGGRARHRRRPWDRPQAVGCRQRSTRSSRRGWCWQVGAARLRG